MKIKIEGCTVSGNSVAVFGVNVIASCKDCGHTFNSSKVIKCEKCNGENFSISTPKQDKGEQP